MAKSKGKRTTTKRVQDTENLPVKAAPALTFNPEPDEEAWDAEGLTSKQYKFVSYYVGPAGGNATKAAEMAGYHADNRNALGVMAWENLRKPKIREAIARRLALGNLSAEWVRGMSAALAASNMGTFLSLTDEGEPMIDWKRAHDLGAFIQIRKYKEKGLKYPGADGQSKVDIIERTIETHNPAPHLDRLAKMLGLVNDPTGASVTVNVNQIGEDDLVRIATRGGNRTTAATSGAAQPD